MRTRMQSPIRTHNHARAHARTLKLSPSDTRAQKSHRNTQTQSQRQRPTEKSELSFKAKIPLAKGAITHIHERSTAGIYHDCVWSRDLDEQQKLTVNVEKNVERKRSSLHHGRRQVLGSIVQWHDALDPCGGRK